MHVTEETYWLAFTRRVFMKVLKVGMLHSTSWAARPTQRRVHQGTESSAGTLLEYRTYSQIASGFAAP